MRVTRRRLRRIIRESLSEAGFSDVDINAMEQGTGRYDDPTVGLTRMHKPGSADMLKMIVEDTVESMPGASAKDIAYAVLIQPGVENNWALDDVISALSELGVN